MWTAETTISLRQLAAVVDTALDTSLDSGESDPHVIAKELLDSFNDDELRDVVALLLPSYVRERIRMMRMRDQDKPDSKDVLEGTDVITNPGSESHVQGRSRWQRRFSLNTPFMTANGWRQYGALTAPDCAVIAKAYEQRAASSLELAKHFRHVEAILRATGEATRIADLNPEQMSA